MDVILLSAGIVLLAINVALTLLLLRMPLLSRGRQLAQIGIVWLVPIFGALVIGLFVYSIRRADTPRQNSIKDEQEYPGVNLYPPHGPSDT